MTVSIELDTAFTQDIHGMYARLRAEALIPPVLFEDGVLPVWLCKGRNGNR